jgi:hypothetical protein
VIPVLVRDKCFVLDRAGERCTVGAVEVGPLVVAGCKVCFVTEMTIAPGGSASVYVLNGGYLKPIRKKSRSRASSTA